MKPELRRVGNTQSPVVVIDDFSGEAERSRRSPMRSRRFRRSAAPIITPAFAASSSRQMPTAMAYVERLCQARGAVHCRRLRCRSASICSRRAFRWSPRAARSLRPPQRAPHFDSTDPEILRAASLSARADIPGTAFYRQRSTGIERVTEANVDRFVDGRRAEAASCPATPATSTALTDISSRSDAVEAVADRLIIYQGSLLHSGIIPPGMHLQRRPARRPADRQYLRARTSRNMRMRRLGCWLRSCVALLGTSAAHAAEAHLHQPDRPRLPLQLGADEQRHQLPHRRRPGDRPAQGRLLPLPDPGRWLLAVDRSHRLDLRHAEHVAVRAASSRPLRFPTAIA